MKPGRIVGIFAVLGLAAILVLSVMSRSRHVDDPRVGLPHYDQVFKYCIQFIPDPAQMAQLRQDPLFPQIDALAPGTYATAGGGDLFLFGSGMFEILLPSQLQVVRTISGGVNTYASTTQPRSIIGCTNEQLVKALRSYGLSVSNQPAQPLPAHQPVAQTAKPLTANPAATPR